jgi:hypothetical protein
MCFAYDFGSPERSGGYTKGTLRNSLQTEYMIYAFNPQERLASPTR